MGAPSQRAPPPRVVSTDPGPRRERLRVHPFAATVRNSSRRSMAHPVPCLAGMTAPRCIVPGTTYLLSRRASERRFFLRPSEDVNAVLRYLLAVAAERFGIVLHAFCVLSNHLHIILNDTRGNLPAFEQYLDSLVARSINALHGHWESFWAPGSYSAVTLLSAEDVLSKAAYVLANPTSAGLVRHGSEWPGLWSAPERIGAAPVLVSRPTGFFRLDGPMPETASLQLVCPSEFESVEIFRRQLVALVTALEDQAARELAEQGRSFLGARMVLAQNPNARPAPGEPRRGLNPRIAGGDKWKRIEAILRLKEFLKAYRDAWLAFAGGLRDTVFPPGTYWLRVAYGARCAAPG
jgi:putative transposase